MSKIQTVLYNYVYLYSRLLLRTQLRMILTGFMEIDRWGPCLKLVHGHWPGGRVAAASGRGYGRGTLDGQWPSATSLKILAFVELLGLLHIIIYYLFVIIKMVMWCAFFSN